MNLARVSANGQITVQVEIRRTFKFKEGEKTVFSKRKRRKTLRTTLRLSLEKAYSRKIKWVQDQNAVLGDSGIMKRNRNSPISVIKCGKY
jgi:bifunctional DNA-binding transcriptional regulator/antitoxin component of YhaV-PrlF toxin-antitoxin module